MTRPADPAPRTRAAVDASLCGLLAVALLLLLTAVSGSIPLSGFDGQYYVRMLDEGFASGTPSTRLRPLVLVLNGLASRYVFHDHIAAFRAMNLVYGFVLAVALSRLCRRYGASAAVTAALIANLFLCISVAKVFAFYPALVDLGAYMFLTLAVLAVLSGRRVLIAAAALLAVLSREFGLLAVLFGVTRDVRLRRASPAAVALTYLPAVIAFELVRRAAASSGAEEDLAGAAPLPALVAALLRNLTWWSDPVYATFWLYFAATLFGGVTVLLLVTAAPWRGVRREPEWLAIIVPVLGVTVLGYLDMWRYSAFMIPAVAPLWAWATAPLDGVRRRLAIAAVTVTTIATQRPWQAMDVDAYFHHWFPYYVMLGIESGGGQSLRYDWSIKVTVLVACLIAVAAIVHWRTRRRAAGL